MEFTTRDSGISAARGMAWELPWVYEFNGISRLAFPLSSAPRQFFLVNVLKIRYLLVWQIGIAAVRPSITQ